MKPHLAESKWMEDFRDFVTTDPTAVPEELSLSILARVRRSLNPSGWTVFAKLFGIHGVVGTLSLSICNQFGLNPFNTSFSLSDYFMKFGNSVCMGFCGFLFIGLSMVLASVILSREELGVLWKNSLLQIFVLGLFSLAVFVAAGAEIFFTIALIWLAGAFIGGLIPLMIAKRPRKIPGLSHGI